MARMPIPLFTIVILLATGSSVHPEISRRGQKLPVSYETPPTGNPLAMDALGGLSHWVNYGNLKTHD